FRRMCLVEIGEPPPRGCGQWICWIALRKQCQGTSFLGPASLSTVGLGQTEQRFGAYLGGGHGRGEQALGGAWVVELELEIARRYARDLRLPRTWKTGDHAPVGGERSGDLALGARAVGDAEQVGSGR